MDKKLDKLTDGIWSNKYVCKLALLDHLRECLEKDNHLKAVDAEKQSSDYIALDKELMDLKILLQLYFNGNEKLEEDRIAKFASKL